MRRLITFVFALSLGACTTAPPLPERSTEELEQLWQQQHQVVRRITGWSLEGRIVVNTEDDGWSGELRWFHSPNDYQIRFSAPFGQGAFQMNGDMYGVEMRLSDGQVFHAPDAESLLLNHIGWHLPLGEFRYWVTGVPGVQSEVQKTLNNNGQLAGLKQGQWRITYPEYFAVGKLMMPRKVYFRNHALNVRLVIDRWELTSGAENWKQSYDEAS